MGSKGKEGDDGCGGVRGANADDPELALVINSLKSAIAKNLVGLGVCIVAVSLSALVLWFVGTTSFDLIMRWRSSYSKIAGSPGYALPSLDNDDVPIVENDDDYGEDGLPQETSTRAIGARIAMLRDRYKGYNSAITRLSLQRDEGDSDDLVDERIMSRNDDDFRYPHRPRNERVKFRKGEGVGQVEFVTTGRAYLGVRSPVYSKT
jgi:hypothetical protein